MADKESDALLDVLHIYSEELLDSEEDQNNGSELPPFDAIECQRISFPEQTSHLGSIKDLITFGQNSFLESTQLTNDSIDLMDTNINNYNNSPLSPLSCNSDSGYESVSSPSLSLSDPLIESSNICLEESFTELFPDLV